MNYYGKGKRIKTGKRLLEIESQNHQSVLIKCVLKNQDAKLETILEHKHMIKEKDLFEISSYLEGNKNTKLGSKKDMKKSTKVDKEKVEVFVNKIWDYCKDKNTKKFKEYVESRAETIKNAKPQKDYEIIYAEIVNDQKRGNLFTPLHYAIKYK